MRFNMLPMGIQIFCYDRFDATSMLNTQSRTQYLVSSKTWMVKFWWRALLFFFWERSNYAVNFELLML
uniref:Uncharacterized protein n=1 Tax=Arundo donax TaxID=35708 RepID=A0A0A8ZRX8_ARUDO